MSASDDRPWRLGAVGALLGGATVMAQAAADARFLSELGVVQLALATSLSSALLALVLAVVGGASDRRSGGRVLASLLGLSAVALVGLAGLWAIAPRAAAWAGVLGVKQLAAAAELAFWMAAAERLDARQSVRALPRLSAIGGIGGAVSAALAVALARAGGAGAVLVGAAGLMAVASVVALGLPAAPRMGASAALGSLIGRAFRDGAAAVRSSPLARQLAQLVAAGGGFAALVFLGVAAAASAQVSGAAGAAGAGAIVREPDAALVALLAALRSAGQIATVAAQLFVAPWLLGRLGTGWALLVAPLGAVLGAAAVMASPGLLAVGVVSVVARALDQALETPAQKLVHTLLPPASRGRVVGFVEGLAKRSGGIAAGLLAALLVSQSLALGAALLVSALLWLGAAGQMARRLPSLAVTPQGQAPFAGAVTLRAPPGARVLEQLERELAAGGGAAADGASGAGADPSEGEERARRAAEVLVALAADGHAVACGILVRAAAEQQAPPLLRAATWALAVTPSRKLAPAWRAPLLARLEEAAGAPRAGQGEALALLLEARALCDGEGRAEPEPGLDRWLDDERPQVAFAAEQARRWMSDPDAAIESAGEELRFGDELRLPAAELLCGYTARALADHRDARAFAAGWQLVVVLRRELGGAPLRARALEQMRRLVERLSGTRTAELALLRAELALLGRRALARRESSAVDELVGWLQLFGALGAHGAALSSDDLSLVVALLGDRDEELAAAAEDAARRIGVAATPALVQLAGYGRRAARDRAAALLRESPATDETLDQLIDRELAALDEACLGLGAFAAAPSITPRAELDALLLRRLDERTREIAHTISLLITARRRAPAIGAAAAQWRTARGRHERARALAVLDTTLPRPLAARLLAAVDERAPLTRARAVAECAGRELPPLPEAISAELRGADASSRRILLDSLPDLAAHRDALTSAAHHLASAADPHRLLRRLAASSATSSAAPSGEGADMPSHVETLLVLSKVPLLADLSTRQLDELARKTTWKTVSPGQLLHAATTPLDALLILVDAELSLGSTTLPAGSVVDDLAWFAPRPLPSDLLVTRAGRLLSIDRAAFEDLCDDVPGLGASLTRALAERLRS